jgi:hypothetical protein
MNRRPAFIALLLVGSLLAGSIRARVEASSQSGAALVERYRATRAWARKVMLPRASRRIFVPAAGASVWLPVALAGDTRRIDVLMVDRVPVAPARGQVPTRPARDGSGVSEEGVRAAYLAGYQFTGVRQVGWETLTGGTAMPALEAELAALGAEWDEPSYQMEERDQNLPVQATVQFRLAASDGTIPDGTISYVVQDLTSVNWSPHLVTFLDAGIDVLIDHGTMDLFSDMVCGRLIQRAMTRLRADGIAITDNEENASLMQAARPALQIEQTTHPFGNGQAFLLRAPASGPADPSAR